MKPLDLKDTAIILIDHQVGTQKTGTLTRVATNDVGIITLDWGGGALIVAIYLGGSPQPLAQQERAIAMASLALYRYFTRQAIRRA